MTGALVREFIEKIMVGKAEHTGTGYRQKRQRVKIIYNYIGEYSETVLEAC